VRGQAPIVRFDVHRDFARRDFDRHFDRDHFRR
jgi:hypothetical protein